MCHRRYFADYAADCRYRCSLYDWRFFTVGGDIICIAVDAGGRCCRENFPRDPGSSDYARRTLSVVSSIIWTGTTDTDHGGIFCL